MVAINDESIGPRVFAQKLGTPDIVPGKPLGIRVELPLGTDAPKAIVKIAKWA